MASLRPGAVAMGGAGAALTSFPALLWLATLSALLGSYQNGGHQGFRTSSDMMLPM